MLAFALTVTNDGKVFVFVNRGDLVLELDMYETDGKFPRSFG